MRKITQLMKDYKVALAHAEARLLCCETDEDVKAVMRKFINRLEEIERFYSK